MGTARLRAVVKVMTSLLVGEMQRSARLDRGGSAHDRRRARAHAVRRALEDLGPFYIKLGQMLSTRPDLVSDPVRAELENLHDQAAPTPFSAFEPVLDAELGTRWRARFRSVNSDHPVGTASLAQAYRAVLVDGSTAVIKVQRPGVADTFHEDMTLLRYAAKLLMRAMPSLAANLDVEAMLKVVFDAMRPELDFTVEERNMEEARSTVERFSTLFVPEVLFASPRVLVQRMSPGVSIRDFKHDALSAEERVAIGEDLLAFMHRGYFIDRRFHADPHPGNILVQEDGRAAVIDWGMVGKIDRRTSAALLLMMLNLALNDGTGVANAWLRASRLSPRADVDAFIADVTVMVPQIANASLEELNFGKTLTMVMRASARRGIQVTPAVSILGKSFANIDGSVRYLAPEVRFTQVFRRHLKSILLDLGKELFSQVFAGKAALEALLCVTEGPEQIRGLVRGLLMNGTGLAVGGRPPSTLTGEYDPHPASWVVPGATLWAVRRGRQALSSVPGLALLPLLSAGTPRTTNANPMS